MTLLQQINSDLNKLRIARGFPTEVAILQVVLGEIARLDKSNITADTILACVKKILDGVLFNLEHLPEDDPRVITLLKEKAQLEKYIPRQMTEQEIASEVSMVLLANSTTANNFRTLPIGEVQKHFKQNFQGLYNAKTVTDVYNTLTKGP